MEIKSQTHCGCACLNITRKRSVMSWMRKSWGASPLSKEASSVNNPLEKGIFLQLSRQSKFNLWWGELLLRTQLWNYWELVGTVEGILFFRSVDTEDSMCSNDILIPLHCVPMIYSYPCTYRQHMLHLKFMIFSLLFFFLHFLRTCSWEGNILGKKTWGQ